MLNMLAMERTGEWRADMKSGTGTMRYANGNQYDGEWSQDVKSGYGIMEWKTLSQRFEGLWARNKPNGERMLLMLEAQHASVEYAAEGAAVTTCRHFCMTGQWRACTGALHVRQRH